MSDHDSRKPSPADTLLCQVKSFFHFFSLYQLVAFFFHSLTAFYKKASNGELFAFKESM